MPREHTPTRSFTSLEKFFLTLVFSGIATSIVYLIDTIELFHKQINLGIIDQARFEKDAVMGSISAIVALLGAVVLARSDQKKKLGR